MSRCPEFTHLLVLPRLRVQNANSVSSPLTHGFPSMTAFLGLMWALERRASSAGLGHLAFTAVGVVSHGWEQQTTGGYIKGFRLTRNPLATDGHRKLIDRNGETGTPAIVEEGRIHLDLSLVFALYALDWDEDRRAADLATVADLVAGMRVAGGTVVPSAASAHHRVPWCADMRGETRHQRFRELCVRLLPGSALVARDDLLDHRLNGLSPNDQHALPERLETWLSFARLDRHFDPGANSGKGGWLPSRSKGDGWIVPVPVGYGALSALHEPGSVPNARDEDTPFRFVESLYSLGEWVGTHRLCEPEDFLWYADIRSEDGLYRCRNDHRLPGSDQRSP